ncbi:kelch domain-containing protein 3-like isoform X2 [Melia azedarach]|uniref:Kelch domain-containing protein 3-like isoform X2 n=1 Tax=Melia azedarach TaxID=155640 RepID=A0ACC1XPY0_MELAZ|nr:kelch domain-containing protein 3-like isoform X2 [Melia azedarach]
MRWERVLLKNPQAQVAQQLVLSEISSSGPGKRWGHTCNAIKGGRFLYVFGGYGKDNCQTNQVHVFDTVNQTWSQPMTKGIPPTPRDSHSCTTVGENIYVFGGTDGMNPLKDLHILDTSSHTWISPSVRGEGPEAREGHSAALVGKRLFVFGGCGKSSDTNEEVYYNDLYILNTETFVWKRAATSGNPPSARDSHTCSSWKNKIIVIGGEDGHDYYLSDVHILDTDTLTWKELNTSGMMLPPRAGHATVAFGKNLFVFGGFTDSQNLYDDLYMLDVDTGLWTKVITTGEGPSARFSVAGDCLDPLKGGVLVFIGGCNKSLEALDDMYFLYTGLVNERKLEKLSLRKQLKLKCQEQNLTPVHERALVRIDTISDAHQPTPLSSYGQPRRESFPLSEAVALQGKTTFQAKVTESFPLGYTIETTIDGKPLRGILFANKPSSANTTNHSSSRKRTAGEIGGVMLNGDCNNNAKASKTLSGDALYHRQVDGVDRKEFTSHDRPTAPAPDKNNSVNDNAFEPVKDPVDPEPSVSHLNSNDDKTNNAANFTTEVHKGIVERDTVILSSNKDDRTATTEDLTDPVKPI